MKEKSPNGKTYIKNDLLDYADDDKIEQAGSYDAGTNSRQSAMAHALPDEAEIAHVSTGGYQGSKAYVLLLDGYVWLDHCSYGSCAVCDAFLGSPVETTRSLLRNAYCFETAEDAEEYIRKTEDPLGWDSKQLKSEVMDLLWSAKTRGQLTADDPLAKLPDADPETLKGMALSKIHTVGDLVAIREEWDTRKSVRGHTDVDTDEFNRLERLVEFADVDTSEVVWVVMSSGEHTSHPHRAFPTEEAAEECYGEDPAYRRITTVTMDKDV